MYSWCSSGAGGWPTHRVLQAGRKTQCWSWLLLQDTKDLQENQIPSFNSTRRTWAPKPRQDAGARVHLRYSLILLCMVPSTGSTSYSSFWKQASWFCWKLLRHCTEHVFKIIIMFGFACVLHYSWHLLRIQKLYCYPSGFLCLLLLCAVKCLVFSPSFCHFSNRIHFLPILNAKDGSILASFSLQTLLHVLCYDYSVCYYYT